MALHHPQESREKENKGDLWKGSGMFGGYTYMDKFHRARG